MEFSQLQGLFIEIHSDVEVMLVLRDVARPNQEIDLMSRQVFSLQKCAHLISSHTCIREKARIFQHRYLGDQSPDKHVILELITPVQGLVDPADCFMRAALPLQIPVQTRSNQHR